MRKRFTLALVPLVLLASLLMAPAASAMNNGRGFYGPTDDVVVTNFGFLLVIFFPTFIFVASMIQRQLEKRKEARKAANKAFMADGRWRGGW